MERGLGDITANISVANAAFQDAFGFDGMFGLKGKFGLIGLFSGKSPILKS